MSRLTGLQSPAASGIPWGVRRDRLPLAFLILGVLGSGLLLAVSATPGAVVVPLSIGILGALATCPFPLADRWLAIGLLGTLPLLPPVGLPNLPLGAAVLPLAVLRVARDGGIRLDRRVIVALAALWASLAVGAALSNWPPVSMWARPVAILALAALASILGALVWREPARRDRWVEGLIVALIVVATTALVVFVLQYFIPIPAIVEGLTVSLGYLRGEGAAASFEGVNNWVIWGQALTLRAFSPIFPAPTNTGGFIGIAGPIVAAYWLGQPAGPWRRLAAIALAAACAVALVTLSRSTWVAAGVTLLVGITVMLVHRRLRGLASGLYRGRLGGLVTIAVLSVAIGVAGLLSVGIQLSDDRITAPVEDPSVTTRIEIDRSAATAFLADMLRGAGLGNWEATLDVRTGHGYVHNVFLEYAAATGIFGLAWTILLVLLVLGSAAVVIRRAAEPPNAVIGLALLLVGVFFATQFLFDDNLLNPQYVWLLLWVVGASLTMAASSVARLDKPRES